MPKYNLSRGWTASSLVPSASVAKVMPNEGNVFAGQGTPGLSSMGVNTTPQTTAGALQNIASTQNPNAGKTIANDPTKVSTVESKTLGGPSAAIPEAFRQAALGVNGTGGVISASAYQYPNPPAYLADAVRNLNSSQGFAQQNLTNLLLQQILGAQMQGQQVHPDVVDSHAKAQKAADSANVAKARAEAAENARRMSYLSNNATIIGSQARQPAMSPMGGWVGGF